MSAYKIIRTEFKNLESLKKALQEVLGEEYTLAAGMKNSLPMYDWHGYKRPQTCCVRVDRAVVNRRFSSGASNDFGLAYNQKTGSFEAIVSEYDSVAGTMNLVNQLKQTYAKHEIIRQARLKGYAVKTVASNDNTVRLQLVKA